MKKLLVSLIVVGVIGAALGAATVVNAQSPVQQPFYGQGGGKYGNGMNSDLHVENEAVHDLMMEAYSAELGISVEELNAREDAGETLSQIALSAGLSFEEFWTMKTTVHTSVAEQALAEGLITQAEADLMLQSAVRMNNRIGTRLGTGTGTGVDAWTAARGFGGGIRGSGLNNSATCLNLQ